MERMSKIETNTYFKSLRLNYRPYRPEDIQTLIKVRREELYRQWFYFLPLMTAESAAMEIEKNIAAWSRPINILEDNCTLAITRKDTGELIGSVGLTKVHGNEKLDLVEIGYEIGEGNQGKGFATEAAKAAVIWGMERLHEKKAPEIIAGKVEHKNWASRKVLEKAGFSFDRAEEYCSVYLYRTKPVY